MADQSWRPATRSAHAGHGAPSLDPRTPTHVRPIYQSAAFEYGDAADAERAAHGELYLYARDANPTEDALAHAVAALEGAEGAVVFSSGMGAISSALEAYVESGGHVVAATGLYGGTHELLTKILPRFGVSSSLAAEPSARAIEAALAPSTRVVYVESISNPLLRIADLDGIAAVCRARSLPLVVDATFATPMLQRPLARGATLSVHSATKYLSGHGDVTAGVVSGAAVELAKVRRLRKFHGSNLDPFAAWLALRGMRTLALRMARQTDNADQVARALETMASVERVFYPGLDSHPDHALARRMLDGAGAMISFEVKGGLAAARRVYDRLELIARAASLGDVTSLMTHPARFSHLHVSEEERARAGIRDNLLRLSVGIEDPDDLIDDLRRALC